MERTLASERTREPLMEGESTTSGCAPGGAPDHRGIAGGRRGAGAGTVTASPTRLFGRNRT